MAANSKRERIILADVAIVETIDAITTTVRTLQSYSDLESFAITQFPVAAIVGRLPVPNNKHSRRYSAAVDQCISDLRVDIFVYFMNNEDADTQLSSLLDDLFAALYTNQSRNDLCLSTVLELTENNEVWHPFAAFKLTCVHTYQHDTGGI